MKGILKRLGVCLVCLSMLAPGAMAASAEPQGAPELEAPSAVLMERETGAVLYAKGETERRPPASVTKVMTLLLAAEAVDSGALDLDEKVRASANDCAVALAERIAGSEAAFVERMNERAAELGLENTRFTNCTGLFDDTGHYSCALDIARMSCELLGHEWIREYTTIWMDSIRDGAFELTNTNKLVRNYEGCTGLKTGYTSTAMYCLAASAEREGTEYVAVIMHAESVESRNRDAAALLDYGFAGWRLCRTAEGVELPELAVELGTAERVGTVCDGGGAILLRVSDAQGLERSLELPESVAAPVQAGQRLGTLVLSNGSGPLAEIPVLAAESVPRLGAAGVFLRMLGLLAGLSGGSGESAGAFGGL